MLPAQLHDLGFAWEQVDIRTLPPGWAAHTTGRGTPGDWRVVEENGRKLLGQLTTGGFGYLMRCLIWESQAFQDVKLSVKVKAVSGGVEQGGGVVWRFQDAQNYYVGRLNPLESDLAIWKVINGNRKLMARAEMALSAGKWYEVAFHMKGDRIEGYLDGKKYLEVVDAGIPSPGGIGLWTKVDAVSHFDELKVSDALAPPK